MNNSRSILLAGLALAAILVIGGIAVGTWVQNTVEAEDILLPLVGTGDGDSVVVARASVRRLNAGDTLTVSCAGQELTPQQVDAITVFLSCNAGVTPVPPTATPAAGATPTPMADHSSMLWHAPGGHGAIPAHEHGDIAPQWLLDAGLTPAFDHPANTSNENVLSHKHSAFKGYAGTFGLKDTDPANDVGWYAIFHLDFNPGGHFNRFHSYQLWVRDNTGAISHISGWLDFGIGNETGPQLIITCNTGSNIRPIMKVNQPGCPPLFETWYANDASPHLDIGITQSPQFFAGGDPNNPSTWTAVKPGIVNNLNRRIEFSIYADLWGGRKGDIWTTQFGEVVSGETDPLCDGLHTRMVGTRTYTLLCVKQTIQPSLPEIRFTTGNSVQREFDGGSGANRAVLPN